MSIGDTIPGLDTDPFSIATSAMDNPMDQLGTLINPMFMTHKQTVEGYGKSPESAKKAAKLKDELDAARKAAADKQRKRKTASLIATSGRGVTGQASTTKPSLLAGS